ncbi:MAG TPA: molybdopterin converting factor subunit 1 [Aestuariivirgaceae bacterium]|jgi:sulfur-carrier protein|nr:molybdopterin converting factor subunit 1 [Aestuariivirgaceae bacterium]
MKVLYFAWVRERLGRSSEEIAVPPELETIRDLVVWLRDRDEEGRLAFADLRVIRAAADQEHVPLDHPLAGITELALFPPVTGG